MADGAEAKKPRDGQCPCCGRKVKGEEVQPESTLMSFEQVLRDNDVRSIFRITGDMRFEWNQEVDPIEGAQLFADNVNELLSAHRETQERSHAERMAKRADALQHSEIAPITLQLGGFLKLVSEGVVAGPHARAEAGELLAKLEKLAGPKA